MIRKKIMSQEANSISEFVRLSTKLNDLLDQNQAAQHLRVTPGTLSVWRSTGRYAIPFVKVGRSVRYRLSDLNTWLDSRTQANGATS